MEVGQWAELVEVGLDPHDLPMHEPTDVDSPLATSKLSSASIGGAPALLLPEFDLVSCSTMTLDCSVQTVIFFQVGLMGCNVHEVLLQDARYLSLATDGGYTTGIARRVHRCHMSKEGSHWTWNTG